MEEKAVSVAMSLLWISSSTSNYIKTSEKPNVLAKKVKHLVGDIVYGILVMGQF